ncbi:sigma-70 family RNA polymerase sigma factor [Megamonas funiformis]|jgi:hypothetical protein|uniref:sigma-70 family RNA polymerase sigma factor n=1 Tax=Megamonas funiformis TaxID=437897 RepID=UPI000E506B01|nr:sigma-70 family RNA polymerase sigma factor [Megamonas funiformis]RHG04639.1 sigma-70 family RNA polymerase sigma factor [Megamonas funiformis]
MNIKQQSLKDIIKNSLNGDINAQDCLIKRFNAKLWKLSYQIDKENAEDIYQDLALFLFKLLSKLSLNKFTEGGLVNYINISLNHEMIHIRNKIYAKNKNEIPLLDEEPMLENPYHIIETNLLLKAIKSYLKKDEWDLLIALVILNIPVTKLSKIYNVSIQAIYQKRKRIQQKIKNICS